MFLKQAPQNSKEMFTYLESQFVMIIGMTLTQKLCADHQVFHLQLFRKQPLGVILVPQAMNLSWMMLTVEVQKIILARVLITSRSITVVLRRALVSNALILTLFSSKEVRMTCFGVCYYFGSIKSHLYFYFQGYQEIYNNQHFHLTSFLKEVAEIKRFYYKKYEIFVTSVYFLTYEVSTGIYGLHLAYFCVLPIIGICLPE